MIRRLNALGVPALLMVSMLALEGCQSKTARLEDADSLNTASTTPATFSKASELGTRWGGDKSNIALGLAYADSLEKVGQSDQQLSVLKTLSDQNPDNEKVQAIYGRKILANGQAAEAVPVLLALTNRPTPDWRNFSALGSAYDQQSKYPEARDAYKKALTLQPNQISVLNNLGMSYALEGNLKQSETTLRTAIALPLAKSEPRIRQNLALVVGLQGRFDEAKQIASEDLPPDQVESNMAYLKKMLAQPNTWQQLSGNPPG